MWQLPRIKFSSPASMWITTGVCMFLAPSDGVLALCLELFARSQHPHMPQSVGYTCRVAERAFCTGNIFFLWPNMNKRVVIFNIVVALAAAFEVFGVSVARSCILREFGEEETAGNTVKFKIKLCRCLGIRYTIDAIPSRLSIEVRQAGSLVQCDQSVTGTSPNIIAAAFAPYKAGAYEIWARYDGKHLSGSPARVRIVAGIADPLQSGFVSSSFTRVVCVGRGIRLPMRFFDLYGNTCVSQACADCMNEYYVWLCDEATGKDCSVSAGDFSLDESLEGNGRNSVSLNLRCAVPGLYRVRLRSRHLASDDADARPASPGLASYGVRILVLSINDWHRLNELTSGKTACTKAYFKAYLNRIDHSSMGGDGGTDPSSSRANRSKVYCYPSIRQLAIKKFYLKLIPRVLLAFRNNTSLRVELVGGCQLRISDGVSMAELELDDALLLAGCLFKWLADACGGAYSFDERRQRLYETLGTLHTLDSRCLRESEGLTVDRQHIVESSMAATENMSTSRWAKLFKISFVGERGIDHGGLRREWIGLLLSALFDPEQSGLFAPVGNGRAIMPDHCCQLPAKYYKFAGQIVAKCIVESARGALYALPVRLHFARSFLAQLLGFHVDHHAFAYDDPELYEKKIRYILDCDDVDDLELTFTDDELDERSGRSRTVEIVPKGASRSVTKENRTAYVDALARHRFCERVREQVRNFAEGFHSLIPEDALTAFDESDLDMLLTGGVHQYSAADMRPHVQAACHSAEQSLALERFWSVVSTFADEQMTRLVQFITGSALLPPGGFSALRPQISISFTGDVQLLPVAHTCYNNLCLPTYDSVERMRECLQIAINEGSHGFGLA